MPRLVSLELELIQEERPRLYVPVSTDDRTMILADVAGTSGLVRNAKQVNGLRLISKVALRRPAYDADGWYVADEPGNEQIVPKSHLLSLVEPRVEI